MEPLARSIDAGELRVGTSQGIIVSEALVLQLEVSCSVDGSRQSFLLRCFVAEVVHAKGVVLLCFGVVCPESGIY